MKTYQQYINGAWVAPLNGKYTEVYNPSDDSVVGMVANGDEKDADLALQAAQAAQKSWQNYQPEEEPKYFMPFY